MRAVYVILILIMSALGAFVHNWATRPEPSISESKRRFAAAIQSIYVPLWPVQLKGDIRLVQKRFDTEPADLSDRDERGAVRHYRVECDARCAALLDTPGVSSVTVIPEELVAKTGTQKIEETVARTFRLVPKSSCSKPSVRPKNPALNIKRMNPRMSQSGSVERGKAMEQSSIASWQSIEAAWDLRLSTTHCIVADAPLEKYDLAIQIFGRKFPEIEWDNFDKRWSTDAAPISTTGLEIVDSTGRTRLRTLIATTSVLKKPRRITIYHPGGYNLNFRFGLSKGRLSNRDRYDEFNADEELQKNTNLKVAIDQTGLMEGVRLRLRQVLSDKAIDECDSAFDLADPWMRSLAPGPVSKGDQALLTDLIRDARVTGFLGMWEVKKSLGDDTGILVDPIVFRLARTPINEEAFKPLAAQLHDIPEVLEAKFTPEVALILSNPDRRKYAPGLIVAQAQRGSAAVPLLIKIIREHGMMMRSRSGNDDILPIDAAQQALCRIGPSASSALPELESMSQSGILPSRLQEDRNWQFMLARIGKPIAAIEKPRNLSGTQENFHENLERKLKEFDIGQDCEANWS